MRTGNGNGRARRRGVLKAAVATAAVVGLLGSAACSSDSSGSSDTTQGTGTTLASGQVEVRVGALLSITGDGSTLGTTSEAALRIAVEQLNAEYASAGDPHRVVLDVENTELEPEKATAAFQRLADRGARLVIGPQSSSEVAAIADMAGQRGVLVVSQGSTASSLAGVDDEVFRFVPTDHVEGQASVDLMVHQGAKAIVPVWREDRGNQGLSDSVRASGTAAGTLVTDGARYSPDTTDFGPILQQVASQVGVASSQVGAGAVAVYLAGFQETAGILAAAASVGGLESVRWYGGDGSAQATQLTVDPATVAFATSAGGYPSPLVALPPGSTQADPIIASVTKATGHEPDAFALAAYDAIDVGVRAVVQAGVGATAAALRTAFRETAAGYPGVTGTIELDPAGDRLSAPYAFWSICAAADGKAAWVRTATWVPAADPSQPGTLATGTCEAPVG